MNGTLLVARFTALATVDLLGNIDSADLIRLLTREDFEVLISIGGLSFAPDLNIDVEDLYRNMATIPPAGGCGLLGRT
jgi:hypothetical protein